MGTGAGLRHVRPATAPTVFVPRELSYPAAFLAAVGAEVYSTDASEAPKGQPWYTELLGLLIAVAVSVLIIVFQRRRRVSA